MDDEMNDPMLDVLANSLEGNALGVKDAINDILAAKAMEAIQAMKVDVAQSVYGATTGEDSDDLPLTDLDPELELPDDEAEVDEFMDANNDELFDELDQMVLDSDDSEEEYSEEESEEQDED